MPPITRTYVKTALVYLVLALMGGVFVTLRPVAQLVPWIAAFTPLYFHFFMVGWVTQLIMGIAYWMFPRKSKQQPRGSERLAWAAYWLLNLGLVLRLVAEPALTLTPLALWSWLLILSATLQWLGGACFVANTWPRVKEK
ncbi:MAG: cbb3-type cytochrome c oxidase subunit I [Anaerolineales bacterium]|nr:cbb3-type cytochrome c oxidase subunit I [Anaerolineales bacterium]